MSRIDDNPYFLKYAKEIGTFVIQSHVIMQKRIVANYAVNLFREITDMIKELQKDTVKEEILFLFLIIELFHQFGNG